MNSNIPASGGSGGEGGSLGGKCKVVDESMADQVSSLRSIPQDTSNHKSEEGSSMRPIGSKAMQGGRFN